ncbi:N-acetyltransferase [Rummeliibacillus stabekisii]|uniref:N-acetyltransferase n=1 Tax=Rummeliibacillus stabekisii TaxID=241244 RepID=UPI0037108DC8
MSRSDYFKKDLFKNINLEDPFFNSLKEDYKEFEDWFEKKKDNEAFFYEDHQGIQAFLYLKCEDEALPDIMPPLQKKRRIKIGTLKINPHGTRAGDRFIKKAIDYAIQNNSNELYVTVFEKHAALISLLEKYGFYVYGNKTTANGTEKVLIKDLSIDNFDLEENARLTYPLISTNRATHLLAIYPEFHSRLFPDSILNTEKTYDVIEDVSYSNSIEKVYICRMKGAASIRPNDQIVIYRTKDGNKSAYFSAVATSICTVVDVKTRNDFANVEEAIQYCKSYSIFTEDEIRREYNSSKPMIVIKMLYCHALPKRVIRKKLIEECMIDSDQYWGIIKLSEHQFNKILELGEINESVVVD